MSSILITGCSSGFGRATTLHLLTRGWRVLATVRHDADRDSLLAEGRHPNLTVVVADITKKDDVARLAEIVAREAPALDALVNNAGTAFPGPIELLPIEDLRAQLEINVVAQIAVTQAVLPALKQARGTIVNVSSVGGRISTPLVGAYSASKFALEALSDALRLELIPFGIKVVLIEPGGSPTAIWKTSEDRMAGVAIGDGAAPYQPLVDRLRKVSDEAMRSGFPPQLFAETVEHILGSRNPKPRYPIPGEVRTHLLLKRLLSDRMWDRLIRRALGW